jgi:hypothetical protein
MPGTTTFAAEVTNVSRHCLWILVDEEELVLPYSDFPWFKGGTIEQVVNVLRPSEDHLYWPDLDVDLSAASIRNPGGFPLTARMTSQHEDPAGGTKNA